MPEDVSRRHWLGAATLVVAGAVSAADPAPKSPPKVKPMKPPLDAELVKAFVLAAHRSLDELKPLYEKEPALINATWDWGGGDFESALGGAAHTGQRAIAEFLLEKGARLDVFAAAMLGKLDVVKAAVAAFPGIVEVKGPHGIPLIVHAKMGKDPAKPVVEYLESLMKKG